MPRPSDDDTSFLGRWSRNKRAQPVTEEPVDEVATAPEPEVVEESLSDEDIAALPALDDLTPQTDIRVFLQKGVPQALRNAALRRKWMLVPGIRDHKDPAVDYAWDWNTPGGVPGDGAAPSPERAAQMLRELFAPRRDAETAQALETVADAGEIAPESAADVAVQQAGAVEGQPKVAGDHITTKADAASAQAPAEASDSEAELPLLRRRHGGALPS
ncbi:MULTISPECIES: DUF3306 domain-containing protein [unclassified Yoonia]|uniref:DUF3306 domain-containing protein n=1 Tax=unclassified Yoonia TaxID=2629118 RepID=UPI002AFE630E|nr:MULTISPECIES: DUF3306 domain-containing protein [unclassified Yoonia]